MLKIDVDQVFRHLQQAGSMVSERGAACYKCAMNVVPCTFQSLSARVAPLSAMLLEALMTPVVGRLPLFVYFYNQSDDEHQWQRTYLYNAVHAPERHRRPASIHGAHAEGMRQS